MSVLEQLLVVIAGLAAGIAASSIGVATLISFPVIVALGVPAVTANVSNTIALVPAGLSGAVGYRRELAGRRRLLLLVLGLSGSGAIAGASLLLALPPDVFETLVPWLIITACTLVAVQPWLSAALRRRRERVGIALRADDRFGPVTGAASTLCGVYGGYFGAGQGVMMVAVLALGLRLPFTVVIALRTVAIMASNVVAAGIFIAIAPVSWSIVALLAIGSVVGGYVGSWFGRRLPTTLFRVLVVAAGLVVAVTMF